MRRLLLAAALACVCVPACATPRLPLPKIETPVVLAQLSLRGVGGGFGGTAASFTGPGDVVGSSWQAWVGLRAFSAADRGNKLINLCEPTNTTCIDVSSDAVTGSLVAPTSVGGTDCTAVTTCTIQKFYNRVGGSACTGSCDLVQATAASRMTFTWNCQNSHPCAKSAGGAGVVPAQSAGVWAVGTPLTATAVAKRTGATTTQTGIFVFSNIYLGMSSSANTWFVYNGGFLNATASDNNIHAVVGTYTVAGTGNVNVIDSIGSSVSGSAGAGGAPGPLILGSDTSNGLVGNFYEGGINSSIFSGGGGGQQDLILQNERAYWGF